MGQSDRPEEGLERKINDIVVDYLNPHITDTQSLLKVEKMRNELMDVFRKQFATRELEAYDRGKSDEYLRCLKLVGHAVTDQQLAAREREVASRIMRWAAEHVVNSGYREMIDAEKLGDFICIHYIHPTAQPEAEGRERDR